MEKFFSKVEKWQDKHTLLRVAYTKTKKGRTSFSGRVIHLSPDKTQLLFYNVDTKSVCSLELNEIDDLVPYENS
jgi:hypothetical protein